MTNRVIHLEYDDFCHRFLGCPSRTPRTKRTRSNPFKALRNADAMISKELSHTFLKAVNAQGVMPGSLVRAVKATGENAKDGHNVAVFQGGSKHEQFLWSDQIIPIEFAQPATGADPFDISEPRCDDDEVKDVQALSFKRISTTVELLFAAQHRVAVFMLFVIGRKFRFTRWDRAGVLVTPAVDYFENCATFCDVLSRISRLDAAALGFDLSATRILPGTAEFLEMDCAARRNSDDVDHTERDLAAGEVEGPFVFEYARTLFRDSLVVDWPRHRLEVSSGPAVRYYLAGKPTFLADGVAGRGTRGYVALDCQTGRFVWLKDVWRMSYMAADTEGVILRHLNLAGIDGVPTLICHGDVSEQVTIASDWSDIPCTSASPTSCHSSASLDASALHRDQDVSDETTHRPLRQHTHYRIAVEEICLPLDRFANGKQLVSVVLDTLRTHCRVVTDPQTRLLHCDVSSGNIMIYPKIKHSGAGGSASLVWTGILSDWELSKSVDAEQAPSSATQAHRLGTYQFMSINLLQEPSRPVQISDELESFFHVLVYYAVRHLRSTCDHPSSWITDYFYRYSGLQRLGQKLSTIETRGRLETLSPPGPLLFFSPLDKLLFIALQSFKAHYKVMDHARQEACAAPPTPPPPMAPMTAARRRLMRRNYHVDEEIRALLCAERAARNLLEEGPTSEERELAAKLVDHTFMLAHLEKFLQDPRWSDDDRIPPPPPPSTSRGDSQPNTNLQLNTNPQPNATSKSNANRKATEVGKRPRPAESSSNEDRPVKRQRTSKSKPIRKASAPTRPPTHAMRTRSQTRRERTVLGAQAR
ncbi:hypothetical protein LXA43DRAFT_649327 [Ganoderma leucocontextum]|nr:hypothetical protein LXA43DRAFT_649327 [Ganoderma leucocontextum]